VRNIASHAIEIDKDLGAQLLTSFSQLLSGWCFGQGFMQGGDELLEFLFCNAFAQIQYLSDQ
jgi:hypothetical protein